MCDRLVMMLPTIVSGWRSVWSPWSNEYWYSGSSYQLRDGSSRWEVAVAPADWRTAPSWLLEFLAPSSFIMTRWPAAALCMHVAPRSVPTCRRRVQSAVCLPSAACRLSLSCNAKCECECECECQCEMKGSGRYGGLGPCPVQSHGSIPSLPSPLLAGAPSLSARRVGGRYDDGQN